MNRNINILIEIVNAIILTQEQKQKQRDTDQNREAGAIQIRAEETDDGSIAAQKEGAK